MYAFNKTENKLSSVHSVNDCLKVVDEDAQKNPHNGKVKLSSTTSMSVIADSMPPPSADEDDRLGWLYKKELEGPDKFNYYFWGEGSKPKTLKNIRSLKAVVTIDKYDSFFSLPFFIVYTKPTGVNDAGAWFHSRKEYSWKQLHEIHVGERIEIWGGFKPHTIEHNRQVNFNNIISTGDCASSEEILAISIQSQSTAPVGTKILVESVGVEFYSNVSTNLHLVV